MIKIKKENIKLSEDSESGGGGYTPTCYTETVVDQEATSKAREECRQAAQDKIDEYTVKKNEYTALKEDIISKREEAIKLGQEFAKGEALLRDAHIDAYLSGCVNCIDKLDSTLSNMLTDCETKITYYETQIKAAEADKEYCGIDQSLIEYKTVTYCD